MTYLERKGQTKLPGQLSKYFETITWTQFISISYLFLCWIPI